MNFSENPNRVLLHQQQHSTQQSSSSQNGKKQPPSNTDYIDTNISYNSIQNAIITNNNNSNNNNNNNNNNINKTNQNSNANSQFPINTKPKLLRSYSKYKIDSNNINRAQANQSNLGINANNGTKPNNGLEYNPLAGDSFKANHTSDVEIVGVKLKNSNQESSLINYGNSGGGGGNTINQATKKKNSLQGEFKDKLTFLCF